MLPFGAVELNANSDPDNNPNTPVGQRAFYLGISQAAVARAPKLTLASLNNLASNFDTQARTYWGGVGIPITGGFVSPSTQSNGLTGPLFIDSVNKLNVVDENGGSVGTVDDVIMQPKIGQFAYVILHQSNGSLVPVPWSALDWSKATTGSSSSSAGTSSQAIGTATATSATSGTTATTAPSGSSGMTGGLGVGPTYTVALKSGVASKLSQAPSWSSISSFDPYNASWENTFASYWGLRTFNSQNKFTTPLPGSTNTPEITHIVNNTLAPTSLPPSNPSGITPTP